MDETTQAVRDMYEQYPYPAGSPQLRAGSDARLLLSYVERARPAGGLIRVLDAGCGRGLGVLGSAMLQPRVSFLGVDINRVALEEASARAKEMGLANVRIQECDLMTLDGLDVPPGGFDVIYSLGVVHHMSQPEVGLRNLREVLAPHGVICFMVYAELGRLPLRRVTDASHLLLDESAPLADRMAVGRCVAGFARGTVMHNTFWEPTANVNDVEFVDRCLNVNEACYDVSSLWRLIGEAGLRFIRWLEPQEWSAADVFPEGELRERAAKLQELDQYRLIEKLCERNAFEMILAREDNSPRRPVTLESLDKQHFAVNPDVSLLFEKRNLRGSQRVERLSYRIRHREPVVLPRGELATAAHALENQTEPFNMDLWLQAMGKVGLNAEQARAALLKLVQLEVLYTPHPGDV
ncbi:MAG: class I SAM-dependent methyltransferase [Candidatus Eisenbacteria sp.]|nr:class I SAM-dependent methyltransferase [Candidatus Eisenbacteria bacterium]